MKLITLKSPKIFNFVCKSPKMKNTEKTKNNKWLYHGIGYGIFIATGLALIDYYFSQHITARSIFYYIFWIIISVSKAYIVDKEPNSLTSKKYKKRNHLKANPKQQSRR